MKANIENNFKNAVLSYIHSNPFILVQKLNKLGLATSKEVGKKFEIYFVSNDKKDFNLGLKIIEELKLVNFRNSLIKLPER